MISDILCPKINKRRILHHVVLTYMGKFHVRNVNESRDVAPCGGVCSKSFIKNLFSPYFSLRFKTLVYWKSS